MNIIVIIIKTKTIVLIIYIKPWFFILYHVHRNVYILCNLCRQVIMFIFIINKKKSIRWCILNTCLVLEMNYKYQSLIEFECVLWSTLKKKIPRILFQVHF